MPIWLWLVGGGLVAWWWSTRSSSSGSLSPSPFPPFTRPTPMPGAQSTGLLPQAGADTGSLTAGLPSGWYWEDQGSTSSPGAHVQALAMSPEGVATPVYGAVLSSSGGVIVLQIVDPADVFMPSSPYGAYWGTGLTIGQTLTLPLSYVVTV